MIDFINNTPKCAIWAGLGLGKTITTLTAITDLIDSITVNSVLIIAPLRVANSVWHIEAKRWEHTKHLKFSIVTGNDKERRTALHKSADVYVINRENISWLVDLYAKKWPFDMIVIDESSSFKSASSQRFKSLKKVLSQTSRLVELTGTPSPNGLLDIWSQIYLLDNGQRLGKTMTAYKQRFFESDYMGYKFKPVKSADKIIHQLIDDIVISLNVDDYLEMPERIDTVIKVQLPQNRLNEYKQLEREFLIQINDNDIVAYNAATLAGKLLQYCIAEGTPVVTSKGLIPIEKIKDTDLIWDGEKFVTCYGSVCNGFMNVVNCYGVLMTEEHKVLTTVGWKTAKEILNGESCKRFNREYLRNPNSFTKSWFNSWQSSLVMPMFLRQFSRNTKPKFTFKTSKQVGKIMRLFTWKMGKDTRYDTNSPVCDLGKHDFTMLQRKGQRLQKLWTSWDNCQQKLEGFFRHFLERYAGRLLGKFNFRQNKQFAWIFQRKLPMGNYSTTEQEYTENGNDLDTERRNVRNRSCRNFWNKDCNPSCKGISIQMAERKVVHKTKVYDLINCGQDNRFTVVGLDGKPLIVHNCNGAIYTDELKNWTEIHSAKLDVIDDIIAENSDENLLIAYNFKTDLERLKKRYPDAVVLDNNPDIIKQWNDGKIKMLLAHPASAGHGLNLQHGGSIIVWFGLNWSLELYQQFNGRLHRQGQTKPVRIVHIVADGCIDNRVMQAIENKAQTQDELLDAMKL